MPQNAYTTLSAVNENLEKLIIVADRAQGHVYVNGRDSFNGKVTLQVLGAGVWCDIKTFASSPTGDEIGATAQAEAFYLPNNNRKHRLILTELTAGVVDVEFG